MHHSEKKAYMVALPHIDEKARITERPHAIEVADITGLYHNNDARSISEVVTIEMHRDIVQDHKKETGAVVYKLLIR